MVISNVITILDERQTGKTTEALKLFLKDYKKTLFLIKTKREKAFLIKMIIDLINTYPDYSLLDLENLSKNIVCPDSFPLIGKNLSTIIVDNFLQQKDSTKLYLELTKKFPNIYLFSSPNLLQKTAEETKLVSFSTKIFFSIENFKKNKTIKSFIENFKNYYNEHKANN